MLQNKTTSQCLRTQMHAKNRRNAWSDKDRKRSKRLRYRRLGAVILASVALICACLFLIESQIRPILRAIVDYESRAYAVTSFQEAVQAHLNQNPAAYDHLYTVTWDENDIPTSVVGNSYDINLVRSELAQLVLSKLLENKADIYAFRLGRLTGIQGLAARGPVVALEMNPDSYIVTNITQTLETAGENQTLLSVYAQFTVQINVSMAGYLQVVTVENEVLLWQNLLLGRVPDVNV